MVQSILSQYWGIIAVVVVGVVYFFTHRKVALSFAKGKILSFMLAAEKQAEALLLKDGESKKQWVIETYNFLPTAVKLFVSKPLFAGLVQIIYDAAIGLAKQHAVVAPSSVTQPVENQQSTPQV
jgi:hypothetical protein